MFTSLRPWCKIPVTLFKYKGMSGSGDAKYDDGTVYNGYPVEMTEMVEDAHGVQFLSSLRVYFPENVPVATQDLLELPDDCNGKRQIRKVGSWFDGNTGKRDIWVVYL